MKFISPSANIIKESNPLKLIELVGRTCYKSEDKITEDSALKFVDSLASRKHYAMLEHANITFEVTGINIIPPAIINTPYIRYSNKLVDGTIYHYITASMSHIVKWGTVIGSGAPIDSIELIIINMIVFAAMSKYVNTATLVEGEVPGECTSNIGEDMCIKVKLLEDIKSEIKDFTHEDWMLHGSYTFKFTCDRGVSHELVRHRSAAGQESTRYCDYMKDKFGACITFVTPSTFEEWPEGAEAEYKRCMAVCEDVYLKLRELGLTPQQARAVLPNSLKTEVVLTMPVWQWYHFFNLRVLGTTGAPHPDMKEVANIAYQIFKSEEGIKSEENDGGKSENEENT